MGLEFIYLHFGIHIYFIYMAFHFFFYMQSNFDLIEEGSNKYLLSIGKLLMHPYAIVQQLSHTGVKAISVISNINNQGRRPMA